MEKERADEMSEVAHYTTKKAAITATTDVKSRKKQTTKLQRAETMPNPNGQRIAPTIDPAFVKKVGEELIKRNRVRLRFFVVLCKLMEEDICLGRENYR